MNQKINILVISCLVYLGINSAWGLKCHVCSGQPDCDRIPEGQDKYLAECEEGADSCRTQEQWVEFEVLGQTHEKRTIRQCASASFDPDRPCYYRTGFGGKVGVCNCKGDGCNSSPPSLLAPYSSLLSVLATILFSKILSSSCH